MRFSIGQPRGCHFFSGLRKEFEMSSTRLYHIAEVDGEIRYDSIVTEGEYRRYHGMPPLSANQKAELVLIKEKILPDGSRRRWFRRSAEA